jgi:hypothetical protein
VFKRRLNFNLPSCFSSVFFDSKERRGSVFVLFSYCVRCETVVEELTQEADGFIVILELSFVP